MKSWSAKLIVAILFIVSLIFVCGCSGTSPTPVSNSLPSDKFVAIYEEYHDEGTVIEGTGNIAYFPVPCPVPMPYDEHLIQGYSQQDQSTKAFYSTYYFRYYPYSGYTTASYRFINIYPYTLESNLTILDIDRNGMINASYMNQSVILNVGDTWQSPNTTRTNNLSLQLLGDNGYLSGVYRPFTIQYTTYWSVENKGLFNKSNVASSP
jgi:hypothetical protein